MRTECCALALLAWLWVQANTQGVEPPPLGGLARPQIAVLPFRDETQVASTVSIATLFGSRNAPEIRWAANKYGRLASGILETSIVNWEEVTVVDRQTLNVIDNELRLNSRRGGSRESSERIYKEHGVTHYLLGELLELGEQTSSFSEYGLNSRETITTARVRVRLLEVAGEVVVFASESLGISKVVSSGHFQDRVDDPGAAAVVDAVRRFTEDPNFRRDMLNAIRRRNTPDKDTPNLIEVVFDSVPGGASFEINGRYVATGRTVQKLANKEEYKFRIVKPGFEPWIGMIVPHEGLVVAPELVPVAVGSNLEVPQ